MSKKNSIVRYKAPFQFNIGFVIFLIIIIYVIFNVFSYLTKHDIAKYQVQQGSIAANHVYQALIIRDETVELATESGYVDYFLKNVSKAGVKDTVYSIDKLGNISNAMAEAASTTQDFSKDSLVSISKRIDEFLNQYHNSRFIESYSFYNNLNSEITYNINRNTWEELSDQIASAEANQSFIRYPAAKDGIVVYKIDGYEGKSIDDVLATGYDFSSYTSTFFNANRKVEIGDPVYKRINSENWTLLLEIDEALAEELNERSSIKIRFCKDNFTTNASSSVIKKGNNYYLKLSLSTGMIRYAEDRFVDVELVVRPTSGLKIPVSAITSKKFFTVPKEYFTEGNKQLLVQTPSKDDNTAGYTTSLISPTIYYETDAFYYIDSESIEVGTMILRPNSQMTYVIGTDMDALLGVYNINKGYAVFKQINILYQNEEYAIVETKTAYGISLYDHIALDAGSVKENQLIVK